MKERQIIRRVFVYVFGLLTLAFGVAFAVNSGLGISPVNSLPFIVSLIVNVDMGICVTVLFSLYILFQIIILQKDFKWINLTQLLFSSIFGYFVYFTRMVIGDFS